MKKGVAVRAISTAVPTSTGGGRAAPARMKRSDVARMRCFYVYPKTMNRCERLSVEGHKYCSEHKEKE